MKQYKECDPGRYTGLTSQTSCIACPPGKYQDKRGRPFCALCPVGTSSSALQATNLSTCRHCDKGKYTHLNGLIFARSVHLAKYNQIRVSPLVRLVQLVKRAQN